MLNQSWESQQSKTLLDVPGMEFVRWGHHGRMDLNMWPSVQSDQEPPTLTGSQLKTRRGPYGGMLTANGLELLFMELLSSILNWVLLTPSHSPTTRPPSSLVTSSFSWATMAVIEIRVLTWTDWTSRWLIEFNLN